MLYVYFGMSLVLINEGLKMELILHSNIETELFGVKRKGLILFSNIGVIDHTDYIKLRSSQIQGIMAHLIGLVIC